MTCDPERVPQLSFEQVNCNLCGSSEFEVRFPATRRSGEVGASCWEAFRCTHRGYGSHDRIVRCLSCGLQYSNPRPRPERIEASYLQVEDPLYEDERAGRELTFRRHLRNLSRLAGPASSRKLLDVGAYIGVLVEEALQLGWDAQGLEPSAWAAARARDRGLPVTQGFLEEAPFHEASFDVITLFDVVEHLTDPLGTLECCYRLLRPGGWIVVHTMDSGSAAARLLGSRWPWLMEMHLYYFDRRTLAAMLQAAGFSPQHSEAQGRYVRLAYLADRVVALSPGLGRLAKWTMAVTRLGRLAMPVSFGDLFTCYARRP